MQKWVLSWGDSMVETGKASRRFSKGALLLGSLSLVVVLGLLAVAVWLYLDDGQGPPPPDQIADLDKYVALGDSYSAGEGVRPYEKGSEDPHNGGDDCHRSEKAYAQRLRFSLEVTRTFPACSAADVVHIFEGPQRTKKGRQGKDVYNRYGVQAVAELGESDVLTPDVDLVTITIGGNDAGFSSVLKHCAFVTRCYDKPYPDNDSKQTLSQWANKKLEHLQPLLVKTYARLKGGASNARILVLGYPQLFPPSQNMSDSLKCRAARRFLWTHDESDTIRALEQRFNRDIEKAAKTAQVEFVGISDFFHGHEPCGTDEHWINFPGVARPDSFSFKELASLIGQRIDRGTFHPNETGQLMMARIVACHYTDAASASPSPSIQDRVPGEGNGFVKTEVDSEVRACVEPDA